MMKLIPIIVTVLLALPSVRCLSQVTGANLELNSAVRLELSSRDLLESLTWWARLGFSPIRRPGDRVDSALTLTDGQIVITLVRTSQPSPSIIFSVDDLALTKSILDARKIRRDAATQDSALRELRLRSPNNVFVTIRAKSSEPDVVRPTTELNPVCGKLSELSAYTDDISKEQKWWAGLGFKVVRSDTTPYRFVYMSSGFTEIGLHEARDVPSLTLTYFMPDMAARISRLRNQGLEPAEIIPGFDSQARNAVYVSPDGQVVYLFEGKR
ncbi:MAG: hypothetical protein RIR53_1077 [Bacteroidota bacterium]|jgi:hypothetical protein